ncbi:hypothetical protein CHGG_08065 [Chaetomium globosum CBS 148.51]|uniref:RNA-directed DNA polymerase n=1 Tax=Chaetomium globosum (strain ATCC 6205 / CBS 148.51 / DSM 1962 / NBRC 6347 / NRRL 1970) TaxID=306901 RepID=Q2GVD9_CHAGB|nr:uncharacterized protein CHGG_08065 [Chaetomium globosum CBS 148.51]EAQ86812.1 hypothetical protein CHGG_08065 [Chaetomium globosum CBS 148.51]
MTATVVEAMDKSFRAFEGKFEKRLQRLENGPQQRDAAPRGEQSGFAIPPEGVRLGAHDNLDQPSPPENFYRQMASGSRPPMPAATPSRSAPQEPYRHRDRHTGGPPPDREHLRGAREGTCDSTLSQPSRNPDKIKREEIGIFNPDYPDPDDLGIVQDGKNLIFTDVYSFVDRIATFTESLGEEASRQILGHFQAILGGSAILWWTNELMAARRIELRSAGLLAILDELIVRFGPDAANATKSFYDCKLYLRDVAADEQALQQFVQKKLRWARSIRMLGPDHSNWSSAMMMIWSHMEFEIQQCLPRPDEFASLSDYMKKIEKSRIIVNSAALKYYPHLVKKSSNKSSLKSLDKAEDRPRSSRSSSDRREQSRSSRREERYRDDEYRPRDRYRDNRRRDRDGNRDQRKDYDRRDKERDDRGKRDEKDRKHRDDRYRKDHRDRDRKRDHDRVHFAEIDDDSGSDADHSDASSSVSYPSDSEVDIACLVFDANRTCRKCHKEFDDKTELRHHVKTCEVKGPLRSQRNCQANLQNPARRTCGHCGELAGSRNALFKHLKHCQGAKSGTFDRPADPGIDEAGAARIASEPAPDDTSEAPEDLGEINFVKEAPTLGDDKPLEGPLGNFTYLRVNARTSPKKGDVEVCFDPGAGRSIVGRNFFRNLDHTIEKREGKVSGIGGGILKLKEWATFSLYLPGVENGKKTLFKFTRGAWVIDNLLPNLLLGNDFMDPYRANIDYDTKIVHLRAIDFAVPFSIRVHSVPCVRRVKTTRAITLLPDQEAMIPVNYKPLPKGRSFLFNAEHDAAFHAVITAKTPKVVAVKNTSRGTITIPKRYPVGKIDENHDSGFLACSWNTAFKTMAVGATLMSMAKPTAIGDIEPINFALQNTNSLPVSAEFDFDKRTAAVAEHDLGLRAPDAPMVVNYNGTSSTPVSDYVYQLTQGATVDPPAGDQAPEEPDLPVVPEKQSTLGIRMVDNLPEIVTKEGVHIFAENSQLAARFAKLVRRHPRLWEDTGLIKLPPEQLMRVPLVEGWQNQRVSSRSYPLSRRDRQLLDEIFDGLHKQGKMIWATRATPFAHPVFVVWRTVKGVTKGRVVIDLRGLNRVSVPDNYPLPLQAEIIGSLRGKRYITAIDATAFFYQFGLHPPHRDRFTLISPRGLEQPTVCLMGYRNSPAHVQRIMDQLLNPHAEYARAFIDDIVIFSNDAEDHLKHLERIFRLFHDKNVAIAPTKSFIGYPSVELLGFRVNSLGLTTTAQRVEAFRNLAFPKTLKALEQWIGATGFLRHLIPYYAQLLEPLQKRKTALLAQGRENGQLVSGNQGKRANYCAKTTFEPSEAERLSFDSIQKVICAENPSILYHFDPDKPLFLQVDGCLERGCGVMVFHVQDGYEWKPGSVIPSTQVQPVMFLSRCLTKAELRYGPSEQEVACLVWAVKKLRTMIHSSRHPVNVLTDHSSTRGIVEQTRLDTSSTDRSNRRLITASVYLSEYDLKVFHLPGRLNFVPDALSRLAAVQDKPEREEGEVILDNVMFAWAEAQMDDSLKNEFIAAYHEDSKYSAIIKDLINGEPAEGSGEFFRPGLPFVLTGGLLYNIRPDGLRSICIPHKMVKTVLSMVHDQKHHFGIDRMLYDLRGVSMVNKTRQVRKFAQHCPQCNVVSTDRQPPIGTLQPIRPADTLPMRVIGIDFIVGLPTVPSEGSPWQLKGKVSFDSLLTVSCKSSKRTLLIPGHTTYTAQQWGQVLMRQLFLSDWGVPSAIISDRDRKFTSEFWQGMWESLGTKLLMTAAYHPQSDGLAERKNQTVEIAMRFFVFERPEANWTDLITPLQWNLNSSYSAPIQSSPHEQLFGFKLPGPFEALAIPPSVESDIPSMRESLREDARLAMDFAAARAKRRYDANRRDIEFKEGDKVYLRLHKGYHLPGNPPRKLSQQRTGPFEVVRRVGRLAYELKFPENMGIHPVISIAHLSPTPPGNDPNTGNGKKANRHYPATTPPSRGVSVAARERTSLQWKKLPAANREPEVPPKDGGRRSRRLAPTGPASEEVAPASTTAAPQ